MTSLPAIFVAGVLLVSLTIYVLTAGADYGGGVWDLLATGSRKSQQRQFIEEAIGPIWEADHVWLILVVVLLFSAFPPAFAEIMTGLNLPISSNERHDPKKTYHDKSRLGLNESPPNRKAVAW